MPSITDRDYLNFVERLNAPVPVLPSAEIQLQVIPSLTTHIKQLPHPSTRRMMLPRLSFAELPVDSAYVGV